jgi:hypothetical protein
MSEEKTIEELQAELADLKKTNIEREIALEKAKIEEANKLAEKKEKEKLREEIKAELMAEIKTDSKITEDDKDEIKNATPVDKGNWAEFSEQYKKSNKLEGLAYEKLVEKMANEAAWR